MSYLYQNPLILVTIITVLLTPFILLIASKQNKETKQHFRLIYIFLLTTQILLGFLNWENFALGRSGFELALSYPQSILRLFFVLSLIQLFLLIASKKLSTLVVIINFINTVVLFTGMIRLGQITSTQFVSWASIGAAFLVLIGNVIGLVLINKDKNLFKRYSPQRGFSLIPLVVIIGIIVVGVILDLQRDNSILLNQLSEIGSTKISRNLAVENVNKLPEVQDYLKRIPNGKVEVDNELEGEYNVHVYEVKNGHTATFNWYRVSIKSGEVRSEFPAAQNQEQQQEQSSETKKESSQLPTGTVSGKICYPSEVIPKGKLEVKRLLDGYIIYEDYPGSIKGVKPTYSFQLEPGDYYIRYNVDNKLFGYSTTVCPTGNETTCADTKKRIPVMAVVKTDQKLKNYDLCDYYYKESNAPKF